MKATVFFSSTARILFSSIMFLAGCGGLSNTISAPGAAGSAQGTFAFVYVLSNPSGNNFAINAFSANSNGQLTPVPGSPFAANVQTIAANRNYLFGTDGENIYSFSIGSNGALTRISSINGLQFNFIGTRGIISTWAIYGIYQGRLIESFVTHCHDLFRDGSATAKPTNTDVITSRAA